MDIEMSDGSIVSVGGPVLSSVVWANDTWYIQDRQSGEYMPFYVMEEMPERDEESLDD